MVLTAAPREVEVVVHAPSYSSFVDGMACWRRKRTDDQLKREFQRQVYQKYDLLIPLSEITVGGYRRAA